MFRQSNVTTALRMMNGFGTPLRRSSPPHRIMKLSTRLALLGCAFFLFLAQASFAKTFTVRVGAGGNTFSPSSITIEVGDKIQWVWDSSYHSTTSGTPGNPDGRWNSGLHGTGYNFTFEFQSLGYFPYFCSSHGSCCNMIGMVNVVAGSPSPTPTPSPSPIALPQPKS